MAQSNFIENAEIRPVYYQVGTFANDKRPKFVRASFVVLLMNNDEYIMPVCGASDARDFNNILSTDSYNVEQVLGRQDFGFESGDDIVIGEHELGGGFNANPPVNSWRSVHRFGNI